MENRCRIRPATARDLTVVASIEREVFTDWWSRVDFEAYLRWPAASFFVADCDGVCGYVLARVSGKHGGVDNVAVAPASQRRGIGRALLEYALTAIGREGASTVRLEVRASNHAAIALYQNLGFEETGRLTKYYGAPVEDGVVLRKFLGPKARIFG